MKTFLKKLNRVALVAYSALFCIVFVCLWYAWIDKPPNLDGLRVAGYLVNGEQVNAKPQSDTGYWELYTTDQIEQAVAENDCTRLRIIRDYTHEHEEEKYIEINMYVIYVIGQVC